MRIAEWLKVLSAEGGSDLYLSTGAPPCAKFQGALKPIASGILQPGEIKDIAYEVMEPLSQVPEKVHLPPLMEFMSGEHVYR